MAKNINITVFLREKRATGVSYLARRVGLFQRPAPNLGTVGCWNSGKLKLYNNHSVKSELTRNGHIH